MSTQQTSSKKVMIGCLIAAVLTTGCSNGGSSNEANTSSGSVSSTTSSGIETVTPIARGTLAVSGKITDELGQGLKGVSLTINNASPVLAKDETLSIQTDDKGGFSLNNLAAQEYDLVITQPGRVTLRTRIVPDPKVPNLEIQMVAPKGTGEKSFVLPVPLVMNRPVSNHQSVSLTWQPSINPGFVGYTVYKSDNANVSTTGTLVSVSLAAADAKTTDTQASVGSPVYYRLYEKVLIPNLGSFVLVGSNPVSPTFPNLASVSPVGSGVRRDAPFELKFNQAMDQASVQVFEKTPSGLQEIVGARTWDGNTLRITPPSQWPFGRTVDFQIRGRDTLGNQLSLNGMDPAFSFRTIGGYRYDKAFAESPLGQIANPERDGGSVLVRSGDILIQDSRNAFKFFTYSLDGTLIQEVPLSGGNPLLDGFGRVWTAGTGPGGSTFGAFFRVHNPDFSVSQYYQVFGFSAKGVAASEDFSLVTILIGTPPMINPTNPTNVNLGLTYLVGAADSFYNDATVDGSQTCARISYSGAILSKFLPAAGRTQVGLTTPPSGPVHLLTTLASGELVDTVMNPSLTESLDRPMLSSTEAQAQGLDPAELQTFGSGRFSSDSLGRLYIHAPSGKLHRLLPEP